MSNLQLSFWSLVVGVFFLFIGIIRMLKKEKGELLLIFSFNNLKIKGGNLMVQITATQKVTGTLAPVDSKGNSAKVEAGSVKVESSDEEIVRVEKNPDNELEFTLVAAGKAGTAQVNFSADADLGDGVTTIEGFTAVEVQAGSAVGFAANFGEPQEQ